jgi:hypothetical protein
MSSITDVERRIMVRDMGWVLLIESYGWVLDGQRFYTCLLFRVCF